MTRPAKRAGKAKGPTRAQVAAARRYIREHRVDIILHSLKQWAETVLRYTPAPAKGRRGK